MQRRYGAALGTAQIGKGSVAKCDAKQRHSTDAI